LSQDAPSQNCAKNDDVNDRNKPADRAVKEKTEGNQVEKDGVKGTFLGLANFKTSGCRRKGHWAGRLRIARQGRIHRTSIAERDEPLGIARNRVSVRVTLWSRGPQFDCTGEGVRNGAGCRLTSRLPKFQVSHIFPGSHAQ